MQVRFSGGSGARSDRWGSLAVLLLPTLIVNLDATVLTVALPTIARQLAASNSELQWAMDAYTLVLSGSLLVCGNLGDRFGPRRTLLAGLTLFALASMLGATASSVGVLVTARALMGFGAALLMPSTLSIISSVFVEPRRRMVAFSAWSGTAGAGLAIGPILAGALLEHWPWGIVLWINVPVAAIGLVGSLVLVPSSLPNPSGSVDLLGGVLSVAGLGLLLAGIINTASSGWFHPTSGLLTAAGIATLAGFVAWERKQDQSILPTAVFRNQSFVAAMLALTLANVAVGGSLFILTQYFQGILGDNPLATGIHVAPAAIAVILGSLFSPALIRRSSRPVTIAVGLFVIIAGLVGFAVTNGASCPLALAALTCLGLELGLLMPATTGTIMDALPDGQAGAGSATNSTFVQAGNAFGVAILGSILGAAYRTTLSSDPMVNSLGPIARNAALRSLSGALQAAASQPGSVATQLVSAARQAFIDGMHKAFFAGVALTLAAALISIALAPRRPGAPPSPSRQAGPPRV